jgi:hypothetical protein
MSLIFDLPGAAVALYGTIRKDRELMDWIRLILSCGFSGFIAGTGAWGGALIAHELPWIAFGIGLVACSVSVMSVLLRMKQGRTLMVSVPSAVEKQYEIGNQSVTEPEKK